MKGRICLVGAGLAHVQVCLQAERFRELGAELVLISRDSFWYSREMAPEVLGGYYGLSDFRIDVEGLARRARVSFIHDEVSEILPQQKKIMTKAGRVLTFQAASFAVGSVALERDGDVPVEGSFPILPVRNVLEIRNEIETLLELISGQPVHVVVIGGNVDGVEYALQVAALLKERQPPAGWRLTVMEEKSCPLPGFPLRAAMIAQKRLAVFDVQFRGSTRVLHIQSGRLVLDQGEIVDADLIIVAAGRRVEDLFTRAGLPTEGQGALRVRRSLDVPDYPALFGAGSCVYIEGTPVENSAVYSQQPGKVLTKNLQRYIQGKPLIHCPVNRKTGRMIGLGPQQAMWVWRRWVFYGDRWLIFKRWLERRRLARLAAMR